MVLVYPVAFWKPVSQGGIVDPFANNVVLFLQGNGTNGSTNIIDSSPNPKTISVFGNTQISTAQSKYNGSSIRFNGNPDYLSIGDNADFSLGNTFTIECWLRYEAASSNYFQMAGQRNGGNWAFGLRREINKPYWWYGGTVYFTTNTTLLNTWHHLALVANAGTNTLFIDGNLEYSLGGQNFPNSTGSMLIGSHPPSNEWLVGYMSHLRITKEIARYTANFNPETDTYLNI